MRAFRLVLLLALAPAVSHAQLSAPLDAARKAGTAQSTATAERMSAADEASKAEASAARRDSPQDAAAGDDQPGVDLTNAAEKLEGVVDVSRAPGSPAQATAPDGYTVKPGDTLWDLSGRFLDNPWYWPKIWSYNPEITNPHWIYPGSTLRFAGESGRFEPVDVADDGRAPRQLDGFSRADTKKPQDYGDGDEVAVVGPYKIGYVPPRGVYARHDSFVTRRELEESGTLSAAFDEKTYLSLYDRAYAKFSKAAPVRVGDSYVLFKTDRVVTHPVTREVFGWQSTIIGAAKVVAVDDRAVTVEIVAAFAPIERGSYLGPWSDKIVKQVQRRANAREIKGYIVASQQDLVTEVGEHHVVFIDKGTNDGVEEGNIFTVTRSGDPNGRAVGDLSHDPTLPIEDVGSLMVVDAQATASAALVVRSLRELYVGDRVETRPPVAPASAGGGN